MGWTEIPRYFETKQEKESFVRSLFDEENIRHLSRDGTIFYVALQQGSEVRAYVVQTYQKYIYNGRHNPTRAFGYKIECETVCPAYYDAPRMLIDKLTPTTDASAMKWRSLCERTQHNRKLLKLAPVGTKLHLVDKVAGEIILIQEDDKKLWVNEAHTLSYPVSLLVRQEFRIKYPRRVV